MLLMSCLHALMTAERCRAEDSVDLSVFALESYAEDDPLPEGLAGGA